MPQQTSQGPAAWPKICSCLTPALSVGFSPGGYVNPVHRAPFPEDEHKHAIITVSWRPMSALDKDQEPERPSHEARGRGGLVGSDEARTRILDKMMGSDKEGRKLCWTR